MIRFLCILITCMLITSVSQAQNRKAWVKFIKDGKRIKLQDDFRIYIVRQDSVKTTVIKPRIKNNTFMIPVFKGDQTCTIIFMYKRYIIDYLYKAIKGLDKDISFDFGIDYKPFDKEFTRGQKLKNVKYILYTSVFVQGSFSVLSVGEIKHPKKYRRSILKLIE